MATPVFCCGFECGIAASVSGSASHWGALGTGATIQTTTKRNGDRALRVNVSSQNSATAFNALLTSATWVKRIYIRFATLPNADASLWWYQSSDSSALGLRFKQSDSKLYCFRGAQSGPTLGASGVTVTTGVWYRIDLKLIIVGSSGTDTFDAAVDGTDLGGVSANVVDSSSLSPQVGVYAGSGSSITADVFFDDCLVSFTSGDYPLGPGKVEHHVPTSDGTHNVAGADDFERTLTGTDITNSTTDAWQLVDDIPLDSGSGTDYINMVAPPNAGDYVECKFGPAPGISTPTVAPRAVEVIAAIRQAATQSGNMEIRINDNGTTDAMYSATGVAGTTSVIYKRKHYATAPTGGAWTVVSGAGNFNNLKVRFGSPASLDVNPDQYFAGIMVEAEFVENGNNTVTPGAATLTLTSFAPQLKQQITPASRSLALTTFAPTPQQGKTVTPPNASLTLSRFAPQLQTKLTPATRNLALTTFAPIARVNQILTVGSRTLTLTTFAPRLVQTLTPQNRTLAFSTFAPQLQQRITPNSRTLILTAFAPFLRLQVTPGSRSVALTTFAPTATQSAAIIPGSASLALTRFAPILQTRLTPDARTLAITPFAPVLAQRVTPDARAMALTTFAPDVRTGTILTPAAATLTLTRLAPVLRLAVTPENAVLSISTFAPQLREVVTPGARVLMLSTFPPVLDNNVTVIPPSASLTLTRFAPFVTNPVTVTPPSRSLSLQTFAPQLRQQITPAPATLITQTFAPVIRNAVIPAPGTLSLTTFAPQLRTHITVTSGTVTFVTFAPTVIGGFSALPRRSLNDTRGATIGVSQSNVRISTGSTQARLKNGR